MRDIGSYTGTLVSQLNLHSSAPIGINFPVVAVNDPAVQSALKSTANSIQRAIEGVGSKDQLTTSVAAAEISQVVLHGDLKPAQIDAYVAEIIKIGAGTSGSGIVISNNVRNSLLNGLEQIGSDRATFRGDNRGLGTKARDTIAKSIKSNVNSQILNEPDLFALVNPHRSVSLITDGVRNLLSDVNNGPVLNSLSLHVLQSVRNLTNTKENALLNDTYLNGITTAVDIANMAAQNKSPVAAVVLLNEIDSHGSKVYDLMLRGSKSENRAWGRSGRSAYDGLCKLINSADVIGGPHKEKTDLLFSRLVKLEHTDRLSGTDAEGKSATEHKQNLIQVNQYYSNNIKRLVALDDHATGSQPVINDPNPSFYIGINRNFIRNVVLDPNSPNDVSVTAIGNEIRSLGDQIENLSKQATSNLRSGRLDELSRETLRSACQRLGTLMGSIKSAGRQYIQDATGDAKKRAEELLGFLDVVIGGKVGKVRLKGLSSFYDYVLGPALTELGSKKLVDNASKKAAEFVQLEIGELTENTEANVSKLLNTEGATEEKLAAENLSDFNRTYKAYDKTSNG
jgi:hypothetical protein